MTEPSPKGRKRSGAHQREASLPANIYLELAAQRIAAANELEEGSPDAIVFAQEAIGYTAFAVGRHLEHVRSRSGASQRDQWLAVLRFLSGTQMFQYQIETLTLALTELDRGLTPDGLRKTTAAQGGAGSVQKLKFMQMAVEMMDEVIHQHGGHKGNAEAYVEDEAGVPPTTIRGWRRQLAKLAVEHRPRSFRRWMARPADHDESEDDKRTRLAPLIANLKKAHAAAKKD